MRSRVLNWIWLGLFVIGTIGSFFYIQGWRFSPARGTVESTGVLELSTLPSVALIFSGERLLATSPAVMRGIALGHFPTRLEKSGFRSEEVDLTIRSDLVTRLRNFVLTPLAQEESIRELGPEAELFWSSDFTRYARIFPAQKAVKVENLLTAEQEVFELKTTPITASFRQDGALEIGDQDKSTQEFKLNFSDGLPASSVTPASLPEFFAQDAELWQRDEQGRTHLVLRMPEKILLVERVPESDDIILVLPSGVELWNTVLHQKRSFLSSAAIESPHLLGAPGHLIYKNQGIWRSIKIGL